MKVVIRVLLVLLAWPLAAQSVPSTGGDPLQGVAFLKGTWLASTTAAGSSGGNVTGTYTFRPELADHILARHTTNVDTCKGPSSFDCDHGDLLYIYQDGPGQSLKAIYFDNEGRVIHYNVSTPSATTAIFVSDSSQTGPQFRLMYELTGVTLSGKFQMRLPGQSEWKSYLEWRGEKQP
jgi:hypothetical protein